MIKTLLKTASLAAAGTLLAAGIATAAPFDGFEDRVDTAPMMQSTRQPVTHARGGARSFEVFEDSVMNEPRMASRYQRITHQRPSFEVFEDQVEPVKPAPFHWQH